jgi:sugar-specific transcriptional regulator TrmB
MMVQDTLDRGDQTTRAGSMAKGGGANGSARLSAGANLRQTTSVTQSDVVNALVSLGFNLNEGRAYAALLRLGRSTGYEVSQRAGVPRSAVYAVLRRLVEQGAARSLAGNPERFIATPPDSLLELMRKRFDASGKSLVEAIRRMNVAPAVPDAFSVKGYERVMEEASRIIGSAKRTLVVSGWPRELEQLATELSNADARGAYVVMFSHAVLSPRLGGHHFSYSLPEERLEDFWEHRLVLVADDARTLIGATEQRDGDSAVLSEAPAIAEFAVGQVALDITLLADRYHEDVSEVMATILGDRVGRLGQLLEAAPPPELGVHHSGTPKKTKRKKRSKKKKKARKGS